MQGENTGDAPVTKVVSIMNILVQMGGVIMGQGCNDIMFAIVAVFN